MPIEAKICGLMTPEVVSAAVSGGAAMVGFVFFAPSPRNLSVETAAMLTAGVPDGVVKVGLTVDADDALLDSIAAGAGLDMLQLHGHETPERVAAIKIKYGLSVMKVLPVAEPGDIEAWRAFDGIADRLMFDSKPPEGATRPGGNARAFDWSLMAAYRGGPPWLLAGGLTADNVAEAVRISGAPAVDVSSGVEDEPGVKNPAKVLAFLDAVKAL